MRKEVFFMLVLAMITPMGCESVFGFTLIDPSKPYFNPFIEKMREEKMREEEMREEKMRETEIEKAEKFCSNCVCCKVDNPKEGEEIAKVMKDETNSSNPIYLCRKIILDNSRIAFSNLMEGALENADGLAWIKIDYNRIKHSEMDAANIGGFSSGVRIQDNRDRNYVMYMLFGYHMFSDQDFLKSEVSGGDVKSVANFAITETNVISTGFHVKLLATPDLYVDYATYIGFNIFKLKSSVTFGSTHESDKKELSSLSSGMRFGVGYVAKLLDVFALEPNLHFNFLFVGNPDNEILLLDIKRVVRLTPALNFNFNFSNKMKTGMFVKYNLALSNRVLEKDSLEFGANLSSNGNKGFKAIIGYKITNSELHAGFGYNF